MVKTCGNTSIHTNQAIVPLWCSQEIILCITPGKQEYEHFNLFSGAPINIPKEICGTTLPYLR